MPMSKCPKELKYTDSHEWVLPEDTQTVTVGITHHAQHQLGELVYVELPEVGTVIDMGDESGVVESVKTASDVYAPVSGEVIEVNEALADQPSLVNEEPYQSGWLYRLRLTHPEELEDLLDAESY